MQTRTHSHPKTYPQPHKYTLAYKYKHTYSCTSLYLIDFFLFHSLMRSLFLFWQLRREVPVLIHVYLCRRVFYPAGSTDVTYLRYLQTMRNVSYQACTPTAYKLTTRTFSRMGAHHQPFGHLSGTQVCLSALSRSMCALQPHFF